MFLTIWYAGIIIASVGPYDNCNERLAIADLMLYFNYEDPAMSQILEDKDIKYDLWDITCEPINKFFIV